jgi:hypothetical protein
MERLKKTHFARDLVLDTSEVLQKLVALVASTDHGEEDGTPIDTLIRA